MMTEAQKKARRERARKLKSIAREYENRRRELGLKAPALQKGPVFYLVVLVVLLLVGAAVIQAAGKGGGRHLRDGRPGLAKQSVNALAEALGRYKFHCGTYPLVTDGGLGALARKSSQYPGWIGPYSSKIVNDPWGNAYLYEPPADGASADSSPVLMSRGPDGVRGTSDDILPDPGLFDKPFRDTSWTNNWVHFSKRGIMIVPSRK